MDVATFCPHKFHFCYHPCFTDDKTEAQSYYLQNQHFLQNPTKTQGDPLKKSLYK